MSRFTGTIVVLTALGFSSALTYGQAVVFSTGQGAVCNFGDWIPLSPFFERMGQSPA